MQGFVHADFQTKVNEITGEDNYYEQAAIAPWENSKFNGVSVIYGEHIPPMPPPPEI